MRMVYAGVMELRTDEAYYWTWSKESALSFLDHPPGIAWMIRFGTTIFGDTNLGVRFGGIVAMLVTQLLLADIVRRVTHDFRAVVFAVLMPEAALYYGLLMAKVAPDTAMIPFATAMLWALVRLHESDNPRWWPAAGLFAGLALLSKFTAVMLAPAVLAFALVPDWRRRWLLSPYPCSCRCWSGTRSTTGRRSAFSWCARWRTMHCRSAPSATSSVCSSAWSGSCCCRWCCPA
jgi:4-amino-4-deoxy-L-arabinose transferase-like glycosyltransferase